LPSDFGEKSIPPSINGSCIELHVCDHGILDSM
jgi:hypothetical protein